MDIPIGYIIIAAIVIGLGLFFFTMFLTAEKFDKIHPKNCCKTSINETETLGFTQKEKCVGPGKLVVDDVFCYYYEE
jgi:hypothetical protein